MSATRAWRVHGRTGHRMKESFGQSYAWDFSDSSTTVRHITVLREDITKTNDYVVVLITREDAAGCESEFEGQLSDGIFENVNTGIIEEVPLAEW